MGVSGRSKVGVGKLCFGFALAVTGAALFLSPARVNADELSDLKAQVQAFQAAVENLNAKVADLEKAQATQSEQVKQIAAAPAPTNKLTEGLMVGGHFKFYLFDQTWGKQNGKEEHNNPSAGLGPDDRSFVLFLNKQLSDKLSIEVDPEINVVASATPGLGKGAGKDISRATSAEYELNLYRAYLSVLLPNGFELKAGKFNPLFSEDYAKETWWDEIFHLPPGHSLLAWHDTGVEIYKNFDFNNWSLPVYFYALNGEKADVDNNEGKTLLLHIAPEFFGSKLKLLGSYGFGKWDDKDDNDMNRYALGFDWKYQKFNLKGEYLHGEWDNRPYSGIGGGTKDASREYFYVRALYRFTPKWRGLVEYDQSKSYVTASSKFTGAYDSYYNTILGVDYFVTESSTIIGQLMLGNGKRSDDTDKLDYTRFTLGWRTTF